MVILVLLILLLLFVIYVGFYKSFYAANKVPADPYSPLRKPQHIKVQDKIYACTRKMDSAEFEPLSIRSFDGTQLFGRYYHHRDNAPVMLLFHGYRSMTLRDCAGAYGIAKMLGFNVIAVDQRAHGLSKGHVITFGIREKHDCRCWAEYACKRFGSDVPILLSGLSMGAATVIMATQTSLPPSVVGVMADCPYSTPRGIVCKVAEDMKIPAWLAYPLLWVGCLLFGGFNLAAAGAKDAAAQSKIPILILHGEEDLLVPCQMAHEIHNNSNGCTQLETFPEAGHGLSYMLHPQRYEQTCIRFMQNLPALAPYFSSEQTPSV